MHSVWHWADHAGGLQVIRRRFQAYLTLIRGQVPVDSTVLSFIIWSPFYGVHNELHKGESNDSSRKLRLALTYTTFSAWLNINLAFFCIRFESNFEWFAVNLRLSSFTVNDGHTTKSFEDASHQNLELEPSGPDVLEPYYWISWCARCRCSWFSNRKLVSLMKFTSRKVFFSKAGKRDVVLATVLMIPDWYHRQTFLITTYFSRMHYVWCMELKNYGFRIMRASDTFQRSTSKRLLFSISRFSLRTCCPRTSRWKTWIILTEKVWLKFLC